MDKKVISSLLKLVAVFIGLVFAFAGLFLVPSYLAFLQRFLPAIGSVSIGAVIYLNLSFVPVYLCLGLAWRLFSTIAQDNAFCHENAARLKTASLLALVDVAAVVLFALFAHLFFPYGLGWVFLITSLCLIFVGFSASIVCFALSKLVAQAAELKAEVDLTV